MKRAAAAGFGVPLVQIYSDIGNVAPDGPHGFGVVFEFTGRCQRWLQERTACVRASEHIYVAPAVSRLGKFSRTDPQNLQHRVCERCSWPCIGKNMPTVASQSPCSHSDHQCSVLICCGSFQQIFKSAGTSVEASAYPGSCFSLMQKIVFVTRFL